jgi:phospholipid N-methyltransferase
MNRFRFLMEAIKNFKQVGTVTRSSRALSRKAASFITQEDKFVLEIGAGDGAITRSILKNMHVLGKLLCFEINPNMVEVLKRIDDPRLIIINDSAEKMEAYMRAHNIISFDGIISAIPFIVLPKKLAKKIITLCRDNLKNNKSYTQIHYAKTKRSLYKEAFGNIETFFVLFNVPPAYVFRCVKKVN